jgi:hypothetical protein
MVVAARTMILEDVTREILARLEEASAIFRCTATSRESCALAVEPSVIRSLWPDRSFVGFYNDECLAEKGSPSF